MHLALERHVALDGQPYFRDLGGNATTDSRTVMWGEAYRSGELPRLTGMHFREPPTQIPFDSAKGLAQGRLFVGRNPPRDDMVGRCSAP